MWIIINIFCYFNLTNEYLSEQSLISCYRSLKEQKQANQEWGAQKVGP